MPLVRATAPALADSNAAADRKTGALSLGDDASVDDDEWVGLTLMFGHLLRAALVVFVPSLALIAYRYHA